VVLERSFYSARYSAAHGRASQNFRQGSWVAIRFDRKAPQEGGINSAFAVLGGDRCTDCHGRMVRPRSAQTLGHALSHPFR
jgi:hypothetical protein